MRVLSSVFSKSTKPSLRNALNVPNAESIKQSKTSWIREAESGLKHQIEKGCYKRLNPREGEDDIIVVGGRTEKWMEINYDNQIVMSNVKTLFTE